MPSPSHAPHLVSEGPVSRPAWQREPELLHQLPGLQTWSFPNTQGALKYFLLLISALPLSTHQQLCNLHFILLYVLGPSGICGRKVGILANCGVTDSRIIQLHPESWSLENPLSKSARSILKGSRCFHMPVFRAGFCFVSDMGLPALVSPSAKWGSF